MKLMVSGYGETKQQFGTMRCTATISDNTVGFDENAARYPNGSTEPGICIKGETRKVGAYAEDNPVNIVLHGMTAAEALILADQLRWYAFYRRPHELGDEGKEQACDEAMRALLGSWFHWFNVPGLATCLMQEASQVIGVKLVGMRGDPRREAFAASRHLLARAIKYASDPDAFEADKAAGLKLAYSRPEDALVDPAADATPS